MTRRWSRIQFLAQRYEIIELLGRGGMGSVYKAADRELDRLVALKVIRTELIRNPAIVERFKQELRLSHRVTHKNVIRMYDLGEDAGVKFITMEYVDGRDLSSLIRAKGKFFAGRDSRNSSADLPGAGSGARCRRIAQGFEATQHHDRSHGPGPCNGFLGWRVRSTAMG